MSKPRSWRYWNNVLHRDVGYLVAGLTLAYAISGVAVNHIEDWNPNYSIGREEIRFEPFVPSDRESTVRTLLDRLDLPEPVDAFRRTPVHVELIYEGWKAEADVEAGTATVMRPRERAVLFDLNFLHLNRGKGLWTWIADVYGVLLAFLAISGMMVLRGRTGFAGRGKWLVAIGVLVPMAYVVVARYL
jgi:uncharacterized protein